MHTNCLKVSHMKPRAAVVTGSTRNSNATHSAFFFLIRTKTREIVTYECNSLDSHRNLLFVCYAMDVENLFYIVIRSGEVPRSRQQLTRHSTKMERKVAKWSHQTVPSLLLIPFACTKCESRKREGVHRWTRALLTFSCLVPSLSCFVRAGPHQQQRGRLRLSKVASFPFSLSYKQALLCCSLHHTYACAFHWDVFIILKFLVIFVRLRNRASIYVVDKYSLLGIKYFLEVYLPHCVAFSRQQWNESGFLEVHLLTRAMYRYFVLIEILSCSRCSCLRNFSQPFSLEYS
jgi:hypothetical protein